MGKVNIYLASHFFDAGGTMKTQFLADNIRSEFGDKVEVYLPHENGDINDKTKAVNYVTDVDIARADNERLLESDILIADMDGVEIDSGVSAEIGVVAGWNEIINTIGELNEIPMYKREIQGINKPIKIIGFTTDIRLNNTTPKVVEDLAEGKTEEKIDNLKDNHLYRNLYTRGLVKENGYYIQSNPRDYIQDILDLLYLEINL